MATKKVESIKHDERRVNIPTNEMRGFVAKEEQAPYNVTYERDPSLDPQLVWTGKGVHDLDVPAVPIYIQEKIHPQHLIEDLRSRSGATSEGPNLFSDFNGLEGDLEKKVDYYSQEDDRKNHWTNRVILGDSLLVMNSLAEKEGLRGKVQMVYIDPPYGIKFGSNWQVSTRKRDVKDGRAEDIAREPEQIKAFRDTWEKGIHSYLTYLRDRFLVARDLLNETGSIFVQIGDENVHLVRSLLDEVFGSENFISLISFVKTGGLQQDFLVNKCDYVIWFGKDRTATKGRKLFTDKVVGEDGASKYTYVELSDGERLTEKQAMARAQGELPPGATHYRLDKTTSEANPNKTINLKMGTYTGRWKTTEAGMRNLEKAGRLVASKSILNYVRYIDDFPAISLSNVWDDIGGIQSRSDQKIYVVQTATEAVKRCVLMSTDPGDLILDPTCGGGTTAYVAEHWGRRWITIDTSRVALALTRTRLMSARYPFYLLMDSPEGVAKEAEVTGQVAPSFKTAQDVRKGFVNERIPHVKLGDIANCPDITDGMNRKRVLHAVAKFSDPEYLYDKPYEDKARVRVAGPFTVESLSPHRVLSTDDERPASESAGDQHADEQFVPLVIENLLAAGVQNTKKGERLKFGSLTLHAGSWVHAKGEFTDADGNTKTVAVCVGPEHGTVGPKLIQEAAKEAVQGLGHDYLVVCGYAFVPHVGEEAKNYGPLTVLPAKMNEDLRMGKALKKTGHGNLFMVFGEPDVAVSLGKDKNVTVEIKGVDVYDPTTGEIRSDSTDEIACWFIDTNYNGESFFVRHAYFLGADEPYEKLKKVLKAEVDEDAWSSLYSAVSRPFPKPSTGKFAVKVINHYGDEILKVYEV